MREIAKFAEILSLERCTSVFPDGIQNVQKMGIPSGAALPCELKTMNRPFKLREIDSERNPKNQSMHASQRLRESVSKGLFRKITKITLRRRGSIR